MGHRTWPKLNIINANVGVAALRVLIPPLSTFKFLGRLNLSSCGLGITAAKLVANLLDETKINNLILGGNDLKDDGLKRIFEANNAKHLFS